METPSIPSKERLILEAKASALASLPTPGVSKRRAPVRADLDLISMIPRAARETSPLDLERTSEY